MSPTSAPSGLNMEIITDPNGVEYMRVDTLLGFLNALAGQGDVLDGYEAATVIKVASVIKQATIDRAEDRPIRLDWP